MKGLKSKPRQRDPFSTPARRRRIIADMAKLTLRLYYLNACDNVHRWRIETKAALIVQCSVRAFLARRKLFRLRFAWHTKAAVTIQAAWRRRRAVNLRNRLLAERLLRRQRRLAVVVEHLWEIRKAKLYRAALLIARRLALEKKRFLAARRIQQYYRGHNARRAFAHIWYQHQLMRRYRFHFASVLQKYFRRFRQRRHYLLYLQRQQHRQRAIRIVTSALALNRYLQQQRRRRQARLRERRNAAAVTIQCWYRKLRAQKYVQLLRTPHISTTYTTPVEISVELAPKALGIFQKRSAAFFLQWCLKMCLVRFDLRDGFAAGSILHQVMRSVTTVQEQQQQSRSEGTVEVHIDAWDFSSNTTITSNTRENHSHLTFHNSNKTRLVSDHPVAISGSQTSEIPLPTDWDTDCCLALPDVIPPPVGQPSSSSAQLSLTGANAVPPVAPLPTGASSRATGNGEHRKKHMTHSPSNSPQKGRDPTEPKSGNNRGHDSIHRSTRSVGCRLRCCRSSLHTQHPSSTVETNTSSPPSASSWPYEYTAQHDSTLSLHLLSPPVVTRCEESVLPRVIYEEVQCVIVHFVPTSSQTTSQTLSGKEKKISSSSSTDGGLPKKPNTVEESNATEENEEDTITLDDAIMRFQNAVVYVPAPIPPPEPPVVEVDLRAKKAIVFDDEDSVSSLPEHLAQVPIVSSPPVVIPPPETTAVRIVLSQPRVIDFVRHARRIQRLWRSALHRQHRRLHHLAPQRIYRERLLAAAIRIQRLHRRWQRLVLWRQLVYDSWDRAFDAAVGIQTRWRQALARRHVARLRYLRDEVYFPFGHDFARSDLMTNLAAFGIIFDQDILHGRCGSGHHDLSTSQIAGLVRYPDQSHPQQKSSGSDPPSLEILHMLQLPDAPPNCLFAPTASGSGQSNSLHTGKQGHGPRDSFGGQSGCFQHVPLSWSAFHSSRSALDVDTEPVDEEDLSVSAMHHTVMITTNHSSVTNDSEHNVETNQEERPTVTEGNCCSVDYADVLSTILFPYHRHNPRQPHPLSSTATHSPSSSATATTTNTHGGDQGQVTAASTIPQHGSPPASIPTAADPIALPIHQGIHTLFQGYDSEVYVPKIGGSWDKSSTQRNDQQSVYVTDMLARMLPPSILFPPSMTRLAAQESEKEQPNAGGRDRTYDIPDGKEAHVHQQTRWTEEESTTRWVLFPAMALASNGTVDGNTVTTTIATSVVDGDGKEQTLDTDRFATIRRLRQRGLLAPVYESLASRGI